MHACMTLVPFISSSSFPKFCYLDLHTITHETQVVASNKLINGETDQMQNISNIIIYMLENEKLIRPILTISVESVQFLHACICMY